MLRRHTAQNVLLRATLCVSGAAPNTHSLISNPIRGLRCMLMLDPLLGAGHSLCIVQLRRFSDMHLAKRKAADHLVRADQRLLVLSLNLLYWLTKNTSQAHLPTCAP